jgi:phage-related protein
MATRVLTASYILDSSGVKAGVDDASAQFGKLEDDSDKLGKAVDDNTSRLGNGFKSLGSTLGNLGIPFAGVFDRMGEKMDEAKSKGQGLRQALSDIGGATLLAGGAGLVAVGVEAVKMADEFDVAQSQLQVAIKNSGGNFDKLKPSIDATYDSMAKLGFNSTEAAGALTALVTSTGNTRTAEHDLSIAADLARAKHISLSAATGILTKTLAGSTRGLTALGLNLDVGSGKLKTIASDTTAYQKAQGDLHLVNEQVADGILKGADAYSKLLAAHTAVDTTSKKLALDQGTIAKILDTVQQKTQGAAKAYGNTLAGQMSIAGAEVHNVGTSFGEFLIPKITAALGVVTKSVEWFERHRAVAEALAGVIGGVLAIAVGAFAVNTGVKLVKSVQDAGKALSGMAGKITSYVAGLGEAEGAEESFAATSEETGAASSAAFGPVGIALMALVTVGTLVATHWKTISKDITKAWGDVFAFGKHVFGDLEDFFKKWGEDILLVFAPVIGIPLFLATHWRQVLSDAEAIWGAIVGFFAGIPSKILGALSSLGSDVAGLASSVWSGFLSALSTGEQLLQSYFVGIPLKVVGWLGNAASWLLGAGKDAITGLWNGVSGAASWLGSQLLAIPTWVEGAVATAGSWLLKAGGNALHGLWNGFVGANAWLAGQLGQVAGWFWDGLKDAAKWLEQTGKNIIIGLWNGIASMGGWLWNKVQDFVSHSVTGAVHDVLSIFSPSKVMFQTGQYVAQGLAEGITSSTGLVTAASRALAGAASSAQPSMQLGIAGVTAPPAGTSTTASEITSVSAEPPGAPATTPQLTVQVNVAGNVSTEQDLTNAIWRGLMEKGIVNGSAGQLQSL